MQSLLPLAETIAARLTARGETIAIAESSTGGLISAALLAVPGASAYFLGGAVIYNAAARAALIDVSPDYLQWTLRVPPPTSTSYFMKAIRRQTSLYIFEDFPRIKRENVSNDFWAPGYLINFGAQPHSIEVIRGFIRQTRQQQGSH